MAPMHARGTALRDRGGSRSPRHLSHPVPSLRGMFHEQAFDKSVDTEHVFVLQWDGSEHLFERGGGMSVALGLEYEVAYPRLRVVRQVPDRVSPSKGVQRRR